MPVSGADDRVPMSGRRSAWIGLALVAAGALTVAVWSGGDESRAEHTHRLAREFRCVDCEGLSVADSATASAREQRRDIARRLGRGESDGEIRRAYVDLFGETILLNPARDGVGVIVWALPVIALILGAAGIGFALRRWSRQPRLVPTEQDVRFVAERRAERLDE